MARLVKQGKAVCCSTCGTAWPGAQPKVDGADGGQLGPGRGAKGRGKGKDARIAELEAQVEKLQRAGHSAAGEAPGENGVEAGRRQPKPQPERRLTAAEAALRHATTRRETAVEALAALIADHRAAYAKATQELGNAVAAEKEARRERDEVRISMADEVREPAAAPHASVPAATRSGVLDLSALFGDSEAGDKQVEVIGGPLFDIDGVEGATDEDRRILLSTIGEVQKAFNSLDGFFKTVKDARAAKAEVVKRVAKKRKGADGEARPAGEGSEEQPVEPAASEAPGTAHTAGTETQPSPAAAQRGRRGAARAPGEAQAAAGAAGGSEAAEATAQGAQGDLPVPPAGLNPGQLKEWIHNTYGVHDEGAQGAAEAGDR